MDAWETGVQELRLTDKILYESVVGGSFGLKAQLALCRNMMIQGLKLLPLVLGQRWLNSYSASHDN